MTKQIFITGGAGFIGVNTAINFLKKGNKVYIFDNFSREGSRANAKYLKNNYKESLIIIEGDVRRDLNKYQDVINKSDIIFHFAGQVAVTTSVINPREDFEINALGTFNILEVVRKSPKKPIFLFSSTNKVYGDLENLKITEKKNRYDFSNLKKGVSENQNLDFHSPYGCSKGSADQYVRDYSRIYGIKTVVFRQSCIYGPHQFGIEDQGWVAWFLIASILGKKITIYGDGKQVRDLLYIDDLVNAYELAIKNIKTTSGNVYNVGGGIKNSISIWGELEPIFNKVTNKKTKVKFSKTRPGDQKIYISDISKAKKEFDWSPKTGVEAGIKKLYEWLIENKNDLK